MNSTLWAPEFLNTTWPEQQQQQAKVFLYLKDGYLKKITLIDFQNDPLDFFLFSDSNNMYVDMQCRSCLFRGCGLPSFTDWFSGCCWEEEEEEEGRDKETPEMEKHILLCVLPKTSVLFFSFCVCVEEARSKIFQRLSRWDDPGANLSATASNRTSEIKYNAYCFVGRRNVTIQVPAFQEGHEFLSLQRCVFLHRSLSSKLVTDRREREREKKEQVETNGQWPSPPDTHRCARPTLRTRPFPFFLSLF